MSARFSLASFTLLAATAAACSGADSTTVGEGDAASRATGDDGASQPAEDSGGRTSADASAPAEDAAGPSGPADATSPGLPVEAGTGPGTPNVDAGSTSGCSKGGVKTGNSTVMVTVGGVTRSYGVLVPKTYVGGTPVPLVFVFHGAGGSSAQAEGYGLQDGASAAGDTAIFAYLQGVAQGSQGIGWDLSCSGNDVAFFDAVRAKLEDQYCIANSRVFVSGFSWGGDFTNTLGCCRGNVIRAIAPASGGFYTSTASCTAAAPAYRLTSGTADPNYTQAEFGKGASYYAKANGCSTATSPVTPSPCVAYGSCKQPVIWCSYAGMAHQLPSNWATEAWAFLATFK